MAFRDEQMKRTFQCWSDMKQRCYNPKSGQYKNYGARGVIVCSEWRSSFDSFVADMGKKPDGLTIDRIDVNGNYEKSNCRWATQKEQQKNRRTTRIFTHNGMTMTMREWAAFLGRHEATLSSRLKQGYPLELILSSDILRFGSVKATAAMGEKK